MDIPPGFVSWTQEKVVCKLQKALYRALEHGFNDLALP